MLRAGHNLVVITKWYSPESRNCKISGVVASTATQAAAASAELHGGTPWHALRSGNREAWAFGYPYAEFDTPPDHPLAEAAIGAVVSMREFSVA